MILSCLTTAKGQILEVIISTGLTSIRWLTNVKVKCVHSVFPDQILRLQSVSAGEPLLVQYVFLGEVILNLTGVTPQRWGERTGRNYLPKRTVLWAKNSSLHIKTYQIILSFSRWWLSSESWWKQAVYKLKCWKLLWFLVSCQQPPMGALCLGL